MYNIASGADDLVFDFCRVVSRKRYAWFEMKRLVSCFFGGSRVARK